jgi:hypothetical protein
MSVEWRKGWGGRKWMEERRGKGKEERRGKGREW